MVLKNSKWAEKAFVLLTDVRFWIILFFAIRLENIDLAPLDRHCWRQAITLGVARNYLEISPNFFEPRAYICSSLDGILAQEFPLFNYLIAIFWKILGYHNWVFRSLNLIVASVGLFFFHRLVKGISTERVALSSTILFGSSIAFIYSRVALPDVFAVSLALIGASFGSDFLKKGGTKNLVLFGLFAALGMLSKIPAACILAFLVGPFFDSNSLFERKKKLAAVGSLSLSAMAVWYFWWVPMTEKLHHYPLFFPETLASGWQQTMYDLGGLTFERFQICAFQHEGTFWFAAAGAILIFLYRKKSLIQIFLAYSAVLFYFMLKAGKIFSSHEYYIIPYIPMMAVLAAVAIDLSGMKPRFQLFLVAFLAFYSIWIQKPYFFLDRGMKKYKRLEAIADAIIPKNDLIVVSTNTGNPFMLYAAKRRGWAEDVRIKDANWIRGEAIVGLNWALVDKAELRDSLPFPVVYDDTDFRIYKTKPEAEK